MPLKVLLQIVYYDGLGEVTPYAPQIFDQVQLMRAVILNVKHVLPIKAVSNDSLLVKFIQHLVRVGLVRCCENYQLKELAHFYEEIVGEGPRVELDALNAPVHFLVVVN